MSIRERLLKFGIDHFAFVRRRVAKRAAKEVADTPHVTVESYDSEGITLRVPSNFGKLVSPPHDEFFEITKRNTRSGTEIRMKFRK